MMGWQAFDWSVGLVVLIAMALVALVAFLVCPALDEPDDNVVTEDITDWEEF